MRKSLIIILVFTLLLDGIGGFLDNRGSASYGAMSAFFIGMDPHGHHEQKDNDRSESHEIVEMPTEDDYCHRSVMDIKTDPCFDMNQENYCDLYISHYPWTPKEIHIPPPKA